MLAVQPLAVTVTEKLVLDAGLTLMLAVVAPVLHENEEPPAAVSVAVSPAQMETVAGEIEGVGIGFTVTTRAVAAVHVCASVTVTV